MTYPRAHLIDPVNDGTYHLHTRCVRRAWLCGVDPYSGRSYEHRKLWLEQRILKLAEAFSISVLSYAIMSNHFHVVARSRRQDPYQWSDEEVVERWDMASFSKNIKRREREKAAALNDPQRLEVLRARLGDLSWFMRYINEPLARMANKEDQCTGRFTESRFSSSALLDDRATLSAMVYVDLNPVRAGITDSPTQAPHTSLKRRCDRPNNSEPLTALSIVNLSLQGYIDLVQWTFEYKPRSRSGGPPNDAPSKVPRIHPCITHDWQAQVQSNRNKYRAYGDPELLDEFARRCGQRWLKGYRPAAPLT